MAKKYYIFNNDGYNGPFNLKDLISVGIDKNTRVWPVGSNSILNADDVPEIAAALETATKIVTEPAFEPGTEPSNVTTEVNEPPTNNKTDLYARIDSLEKECKTLRKKVNKLERDIKVFKQQKPNVNEHPVPPPPSVSNSTNDNETVNTKNHNAENDFNTSDYKWVLFAVLLLVVITSILIGVGNCSRSNQKESLLDTSLFYEAPAVTELEWGDTT